MNIHTPPPPPISALATALDVTLRNSCWQLARNVDVVGHANGEVLLATLVTLCNITLVHLCCNKIVTQVDRVIVPLVITLHAFLLTQTRFLKEYHE